MNEFEPILFGIGFGKVCFIVFFWNLTSKKNEWYFLLGWVIIMFMLHTYTVL